MTSFLCRFAFVVVDVLLSSPFCSTLSLSAASPSPSKTLTKPSVPRRSTVSSPRERSVGRVHGNRVHCLINLFLFQWNHGFGCSGGTLSNSGSQKDITTPSSHSRYCGSPKIEIGQSCCTSSTGKKVGYGWPTFSSIFTILTPETEPGYKQGQKKEEKRRLKIPVCNGRTFYQTAGLKLPNRLCNHFQRHNWTILSSTKTQWAGLKYRRSAQYVSSDEPQLFNLYLHFRTGRCRQKRFNRATIPNLTNWSRCPQSLWSSYQNKFWGPSSFFFFLWAVRISNIVLYSSVSSGTHTLLFARSHKIP